MSIGNLTNTVAKQRITRTDATEESFQEAMNQALDQVNQSADTINFDIGERGEALSGEANDHRPFTGSIEVTTANAGELQNQLGVGNVLLRDGCIRQQNVASDHKVRFTLTANGATVSADMIITAANAPD